MDVFALGKEGDCFSLNLLRAGFQMTYNHLSMKIEVVRQWNFDIDTVVGAHNSECSLIRGENCGIVLWIIGHLRVIISVRNIWPLWSCWDVK